MTAPAVSSKGISLITNQLIKASLGVLRLPLAVQRGQSWEKTLPLSAFPMLAVSVVIAPEYISHIYCSSICQVAYLWTLSTP